MIVLLCVDNLDVKIIFDFHVRKISRLKTYPTRTHVIKFKRLHLLFIATDTFSAKVLRMSEVEETLNRIKTHKGVKGIVIANSDGLPLRSTLESSKALYGFLVFESAHSKRSRRVQHLN